MSVYRKILIPVDGSPTSNRGLIEAIELARNQHAALRLVHVLDELLLGPGAEAVVYLENTVDLLRETGKQVVAEAEALVRKSGLKSEAVMLEIMGGRAAGSIVAEANAWGADLIVLGTHGRRGTKRLVMGSDAEEVVRTAPVPVLLVRMVGQATEAEKTVAAVGASRIGGKSRV